MGLFDWIKGKKPAQRDVSLPVFSVSVQVSSDPTAELNRQATRLKDEGRMDEAIATLRVVASMQDGFAETPSMGTRLPLYMQQGGMPQEAVAEMIRLISLVPEAMKVNPCIKASGRANFEAQEYAVLFDKLGLILKRQKRPDLAGPVYEHAKKWSERAAAMYAKKYGDQPDIAIPRRPKLFDFSLIKLS